MRIAIGILGTLLTAFATWILLIWLRVPRGFGGLEVTTPFGPISVIHGNFLIPTPFDYHPYRIPLWSLIVLGALLALWGFLGFRKKRAPAPLGFPVEKPQPPNH